VLHCELFGQIVAEQAGICIDERYNIISQWLHLCPSVLFFKQSWPLVHGFQAACMAELVSYWIAVVHVIGSLNFLYSFFTLN